MTSFLGAPNVKAVRGFTMFGMSFVYVVFKDGTDIYWARSRVVEQLAKVKDKLPEGITPEIGPDATSVGWVYQYVLVDETGKHNLQELRSLQDGSLRYWLQGVEGVAEVAGVTLVAAPPDEDHAWERALSCTILVIASHSLSRMTSPDPVRHDCHLVRGRLPRRRCSGSWTAR